MTGLDELLDLFIVSAVGLVLWMLGVIGHRKIAGPASGPDAPSKRLA